MLVPFLHGVGGMERQAVQLAGKLRERGAEVVFVTGFYIEEYVKQRYPGIHWRDSVQGIPVYRVPVTRLMWRLRLLSFAAFAFILLATSLRRFQIIHAHQLTSTGVAAAAIGGVLRRPVIVKLASGGYVGDLVALRRVFWGHPPVGFLARRLDRIVSLTIQMQSELLAVGFPRDKITLIPNGVDITRFHPGSCEEQQRLRSKLGLPHGKKIVAFVGGLKPKKRVELLISAWDLLRGQRAGSHLLLIGDGPLQPRLEEQCRSFGLEESVSFVGMVGNVDEYLRASDVFVLPSIGEGLPNALLEAMATGLPVITTDTRGNRDVITHGKDGLLFPLDDIPKLAGHLANVLHNEKVAEQLGQAAHATVRHRFSLERVADSYLELYSSLLQERAGI